MSNYKKCSKCKIDKEYDLFFTIKPKDRPKTRLSSACKDCLKYKRKIKSLNENYFNDINYNSAYFIGFITGDGNIGTNDSGNKFLQIALNEKDKEILDKLILELHLGRHYTKYKLKQESGLISNIVRIKVTSNILCESLIKLNIVPRKTGIEKLPISLNGYLPDYIRGLFDADGSLAIKNKKTKSGTEYKTYTFSICSSSTMVEAIKEYFGFGKIEKGHGDCWSYYVNKREDIIKIKNILYHSNDIFFLKRKKDRFNDMVGEIK